MRKTILSVLSLFAVLLMFVNLNANSKITVNIFASFTDNTNVSLLENSSVEYGSTIYVTANDIESETFAYWIVDGIVDPNKGASTSFVATNNLEAVAIYHSSNNFAVSFVDHSGSLIETKYVDVGDDVEEPAKLPTKYGYEHNNPKWQLVYGSSSDFANIDENKVFKLRYKRLGDLDKILINGIEHGYNDVVTLTPENPNFSYWEENGKVISFKENYSFSALYDRNIIEVSNDNIEQVPLITVSHNLKIRLGFISKVAQVELPNGYTLLEQGFLVSDVELASLTLDNAIVVKASAIHPLTNEYLTSINNDYNNIRAYAIYKDTNNNIKTIYSDLVVTGELEEGFENRGLTSSYLDGTFVGNSGVLFKYGYARYEENFPIDGSGLMLHNANASYLEITFVNGLNFLFFDYRKAHTASAARQLEIYINGNVIHTTSIFGNSTGADDTIHSVSLTDLDYRGITVVKIKNVGSTTTNRQTVLDNIKWTEFGPDIESVPYYSVSFDTLGGNVIDPLVVKEGKKVDSLPIPTKYAHEFLGWTLGEVEYDLDTLISQDITLVALWKELEETEAIKLNKQIDFGEVDKTGYALGYLNFVNGDYTSYSLYKDRAQINTKDGKNKPSLVMAPVKTSGVIHNSFVEFDLTEKEDLAKIEFSISSWSTASYNRIINKLNSITLSLEKKVGSNWIKVADIHGNTNIISYLQEDDYVFVVFEVTDQALYRISYTHNDPTTGNADQAITVDYFNVYIEEKMETSATVTFNYNYETGNLVVTKEVGNRLTPYNPERLAHSFLGWYYGNELFDYNNQLDGDILLVARWERTDYNVRFDLGYIPSDISLMIEDILVPMNGFLPTIEEPQRDGYEFKGWYETKISVDINEEFDFTKTINEDKRLVAKWEKTVSNPVYQRDDDLLLAYYISVTDKTGEALFLELNNLLNNYTKVSYGDARYILDIADVHPYDSNMVLTIYDRNIVSGPWSWPVWEREHVWPNSKLGVDRADNNTTNQASDLHNLRAIIPKVNQRRSNLYYVNPVEQFYSPIGHIVVNGKNYYPGDEDKGDVARILLYMAVMYKDVLTLTNDVSLIENQDLNNKPAGAYLGTLSLLYDWHLEDPVDDFEINRNNVIYSYQGNRNPFIDHPELFFEIWDYLMEADDLMVNNEGRIVIEIDDYTVFVDYEFFRRKRNEFLM